MSLVSLAEGMVEKTDVLKAMEAVESSSAAARKKTPPSDADRKKQLIRELGRKPSEERVSLYVRRQSDAGKKEENASKAKSFMDKMAKKTVETDFLKTIEEEEKPAVAEKKSPFAKKYPLNRTTTPNSLREHLKETLTANLQSNDLSDTIQSIRDEEIRDTFDVDAENVETPPAQRRTAANRSFRVAGSAGNLDQAGRDDFGGRRRNAKFRSLAGDGGKPLGDRELALKKSANRSSLARQDEEDEDGVGQFDRYSAARRSVVRAKDEDTKSLAGEIGSERRPSKGADWRSRLASKFKKGDQYTLSEEADNQPRESYRRTSADELPTAPMTEPVKRRGLAAISGGGRPNDLGVNRNGVGKVRPSQINGRKTSYGDYDSELVDGKYVTSVPIMSPEDEDKMLLTSRGNVRAGAESKGLRELKRMASKDNDRADRKESLMERLSGNKDSSRRATTNVFDRLQQSSVRGSRNNLSGSRQSLNEDKKSGGALSRIKDLTKGLRKSSKEEVVAPRSSMGLTDGRRATTASGTPTSSTRSLHKDSNGVGFGSGAGRTGSPRTAARRATANISESQCKFGIINATILATTRAAPSRATTSTSNGHLAGRRRVTEANNNVSKENLSRSSSSRYRLQASALHSLTFLSTSANDLTHVATTPAANTKTSTATLRMSNVRKPAAPVTARRATASSSLSFMKPTASSAKKLAGTEESAPAKRVGPATKARTTPTAARITRR